MTCQTSNAEWAAGSRIYMGDLSTPTVYTEVAEVRDMTPFSASRDDIEVTSRGTSASNSAGSREFIGGYRDFGEISFDANWLIDNATQDEVTGLLYWFTSNDTPHPWRIVSPSGLRKMECCGYVSAFEPDYPLEDRASLSCTIKISGAVTVSDV